MNSIMISHRLDNNSIEFTACHISPCHFVFDLSVPRTRMLSHHLATSRYMCMIGLAAAILGILFPLIRYVICLSLFDFPIPEITSLTV